MTRHPARRVAIAVLAMGLLTAAWSCGSMDEGTPVPAGKTQEKPPNQAGKSTGRGEQDQPGKFGGPQTGEETTGDRSRSARTTGLDAEPGLVTGPEQLRNGLTILPVSGGPREIASIRLTVEAGSPLDPKGKSGLAALCAGCLIEFGKEDAEGEALSDRLARLSARLQPRMEGRRAGFEISGPRRHLLPMVRILFELMTGEPPRPAQVEQVKRRLLHGLSQTRDQRLRSWQIQRALGLFPPTPKEQEDELAALEAGIVQLFYTSYYRPQTALLSIEAEGFDKSERGSIAKLFDPWKAGPDLPDPIPLGQQAPVNYTPWEGPGAEVILILPDPDPAYVGHGIGEVTWQILCMDGHGGWIGERLKAAGLGRVPVRVKRQVFDRLRVRTLSYRIESSLVGKLTQALGEAFAVLGTEEPSVQDFRTAVGRARLEWNLRMGTPAGRIDALDLAFLAGRQDQLDAHVLASVKKLRPKDYPGVAAPWTQPHYLIRGPQSARPTDSRLLALPKEGARPITVREKVQSLSLSEAEAKKLAAAAYVLAQNSIAGADTLRAFGQVGYVAQARFVASIPFSETWSYDMAKGLVERRRTILSTEIRTFVEKNEKTGKTQVVEEVEGKRRILDRGESELFRIEAVTQPHAFLATMLRQKITPRLGGRMKSGGRRYLALDFEFQGQELRLFVDEENGLPRRLVYPEWRQSTRPRKVTLLYEAYDKDGRFQLPGRISKYVDGEFRGEFLLSYPRRDR